MISPISSSSNSFSESSSAVLSLRDRFPSLLEQVQASDPPPAPTTAQTTLPPNAQPGASAAAATVAGGPVGASGSTGTATAPGRHHHHMHVQGGLDSDSDSDTNSTGSTSLGQLGQPVQAANASAAQQAYGGLPQDLQQIALNGDLLNAQAAFLQESALSISA